MSVDPVTTSTNDGSSFNRYVYAEKNPYKYVDPDGRAVMMLPFASRLLSAAIEKGLTALAVSYAALQAVTISNQSSQSGSGNTGGSGTTAVPPAPAAGAPGANSPDITPDELRDKSRSDLEQQAKDKGLTQDPKKPNKWRDPVTGDERMRIDPGHRDPKTGQPYSNPRAAKPHVHGYDQAGNKIRDPSAGNDPHFPIKP